jgi:hypothetical protein
MEQKIRIRGKVNVKLMDLHGNVINEETKDNLIVDSGLDGIADLLDGTSSNAFDYIAIGEGTTAPVVGDTTLENESKRELANVSQPSSNQVEYTKVFSFASGESFNITEAGVLDSASVGVLLNRLTFTAKAVDVTTTLSVTITITIDRV